MSDTPIDPVLAARVEAIRALADHQSERVMVVSPNLTVIYANHAAWPTGEVPITSSKPTKCYEAILHRQVPCSACPVTEVFASGEVKSVACSAGGVRHACGMSQAYPLKASTGRTDSVLVLFRDVRDSDAGAQTVTDRPGSVSNEPQGAGLGDLVGRGPAMRKLFDTITLVANSQATVLLQGESGSGKELVARTIHRLSPRREKPLVVVECSSLPETLLESELFGHVKGAFTGAVTTRRGLFEEADGGTIFLDEIADTTLTFQAKLLRVLQEGEVKPVGSSRSVKVDVRVVSATNKSLFDLVKAKQFREDLYYRLAVLPIFMPPLRHRAEDIPLLIDRFVAQTSRRHNRPCKPVTQEAAEALAAHEWPGNVRELLNLVERVVVTAKGDRLTLEDFFGPAAASPGLQDLRTVVRDVASQTERTKIVEALAQADGNRVRAAKLLNISRASLYNKLRVYGLADA
ncbi:MAG: sigma-54 interaction domain-containing protein [Nitrospiraceae bacterium]